nr:hypothetical protein [Tanacetum cinerariifolium]
SLDPDARKGLTRKSAKIAKACVKAQIASSMSV